MLVLVIAYGVRPVDTYRFASIAFTYKPQHLLQQVKTQFDGSYV